MNYSQSFSNPAASDIVIPGDGASAFDLNPTSGTQFSSATPADSPVFVQGVELSYQQARALGYVADSTKASQMGAQQPEADQLPAQDAQDASEEASETSEGNEDAIISDEAVEHLCSLMTDRGDVVASAITDVLNDGDIGANSLQDIANASGLDVEQSSELFSQVSEYLNTRLDGHASLLSLANEQDSQATKSAIFSMLNGSDADAQRLVAITASTIDTSSRSEELVEGLEDAGYECSFQNGRLYLSGNEYGTTPQPWSRVYSAFDMSLG